MDAVRFGRSIRALRRRRGWRQLDLAEAAGVSQQGISRLERGLIDATPIGSIVRVSAALEAQVDLVLRWRGEHLDRLLDERHAALVELAVRRLRSYGWEAATEVSFAIYGERGSVDVLAWHDGAQTALVVEVKSTVPDVQATLAAHDRKARLGRRIAATRGWRPRSIGRLLVVLDGTTERRRVEQHSATFDATYPLRSVELRRALREPETFRGRLDGLLFLPLTHAVSGRQRCTALGRSRVRAPRASPAPLRVGAATSGGGDGGDTAQHSPSE